VEVRGSGAGHPTTEGQKVCLPATRSLAPSFAFRLLPLAWMAMSGCTPASPAGAPRPDAGVPDERAVETTAVDRLEILETLVAALPGDVGMQADLPARLDSIIEAGLAAAQQLHQRHERALHWSGVAHT
jgi:hypothetical protein